jgi:hypothetical protein
MAVMSVHDLFTQAGRDQAWRRLRLRLARRGLGLPRRGPGCSARSTARSSRRLAAIDRALAKETPRLASMFAMFNQLAAEEPVGAERLPSRAWPRPGLAQFAFLATLAAIVALSVVLSTQMHGVMRSCLTSASGSPSASSSGSPFATPFASSSASPAAGQAGGGSRLAAFVPVRGLSCQAYAAPNK